VKKSKIAQNSLPVRPQPDRLLRGDDILDGEDLILNFKVPVNELFRTLAF
jgi:hypothetical protein